MPVIDPSGGPANRTRSRTSTQQRSPGNGAGAPSDPDPDAGPLALPQSSLPGSTSEVAMRMPCGREVALKVAASGYREEETLRNEVQAYLAVQDLWNRGVPELLLAGDLCAVGSGYGLGTAVLSGRPLQKGCRSTPRRA
ncbi:hypothetical protein COCOBI_09-1030 [Coccomyxa sp. Obi]|nr:hypothetical protein COCOBI_09-1030 [Coccomyxa sp. Obi]